MKQVLTPLLIILFSLSAKAQWYTVTNLSGTSAIYGTTNVAVLGGGTFSTYPGWCGAIPYWIGDGTGGTPDPGWYTYTFTPSVTSVRIFSTASDPGESISIYVNGARYHLTLANLTAWASTCGTPVMTLSGDSLISISGNSSAELNITDCPINSIEVETDGLENGTVFTFMFSDSASCFRAVSTAPCAGDTIYLDAIGDSTGATYLWTGPGGFTSTLKNPFIYPSVFADTGVYTVIRTISGGSDTSRTDVVIHPIPIINVTSNAPLCDSSVDTLMLNVTPDSAGEVFTWTGPVGYTATGSSPTLIGFGVVNVGTYHVRGTTIYGCSDTASIDATVRPRPAPPVITDPSPYCEGYPFTPFTVAATSTVFWWPAGTGGVSSTTAPVINTSVPGLYTVWASQGAGSCQSARSMDTVRILPRIVPGFTFTPHYGCNFDTVYFTNTTANASTYLWYFGDGTPTDNNMNTYHVYSGHDLFSVTLHLSNGYCDSSITLPVDLRHAVKALFSPVPDTFCIGQSINLLDSSYSSLGYSFRSLYSDIWNFGDGGTDATFSPAHTYALPGVYPVSLTVTDSIGCVDTMTRDVYVLQLHLSSFSDTMLCISQPLPMANVLTVTPNIILNYTYQWSPGNNLSDSMIQVPDYSGFGLTTYTLTASINPYGCAAQDVITIHSVLGAVIADLTPTTTIPLGASIQLNADSEALYRWTPDDGSLNNDNINDPIATPNRTTLYTVYGYDVNGCLDSGYVEIIVDSTLEEGIPSGFTPNGDGLNDVFKPIGQKFEKLVDFRIYNRWGQQVFYSNNFNDGWDGTFNGVPQDMGNYFYSIIIARPGGDGDNIMYKGEVTLIR